ncbi:GNAT family N-acetyltransferase [Actinoallomurus spadix]|uniref:N-acetyltransferase domain-containing protein n=1 Tax=Actinoallomurus spadix TaxID=79912 RepID=A0ABN0W6I0_9ACTN|nr:GNAT family N-acetyltransferase [Actinoallomurus spadix]MCO5986239.1 GNAT family N-acetyltransferase [Actinoallomurus spadix]
MTPNLLERAGELWASLAGVPVAFPPCGDVRVVASPESRMCPPRWAGIVALGGGVLATVPAPGLIEPVRSALLGLGQEADLEPARLRSALPVMEALGPATLAYLDGSDFTAVHRDAGIDVLPPGHQDVRRFLASAVAHDSEESGLADVTSATFVIRRGREVIAASGYRPWAGIAAQLSVLTAPEHRGHGLARIVASKAVADASARGLLPQWRARFEPSLRVARALGFRVVGAQLSIRLTTEAV